MAGKTRHVERTPDHAARTGTDHRPKVCERMGRQATRHAHVVRRTGQIGGAVDQRAVQIEQNGPNRPACKRTHATRLHASR
jgi:hypothetical protein